ncbi:MAG: hypothetical protein M1812_002853 [Candelaria pacifica]|nr:MAG: hypothetical protein M1812_002853 [Candelaria pacifica]
MPSDAFRPGAKEDTTQSKQPINSSDSLAANDDNHQPSPQEAHHLKILQAIRELNQEAREAASKTLELKTFVGEVLENTEESGKGLRGSGDEDLRRILMLLEDVDSRFWDHRLKLDDILELVERGAEPVLTERKADMPEEEEGERIGQHVEPLEDRPSMPTALVERRGVVTDVSQQQDHITAATQEKTARKKQDGRGLQHSRAKMKNLGNCSDSRAFDDDVQQVEKTVESSSSLGSFSRIQMPEPSSSDATVLPSRVAAAQKSDISKDPKRGAAMTTESSNEASAPTSTASKPERIRLEGYPPVFSFVATRSQVETHSCFQPLKTFLASLLPPPKLSIPSQRERFPDDFIQTLLAEGSDELRPAFAELMTKRMGVISLHVFLIDYQTQAPTLGQHGALTRLQTVSLPLWNNKPLRGDAVFVMDDGAWDYRGNYHISKSFPMAKKLWQSMPESLSETSHRSYPEFLQLKKEWVVLKCLGYHYALYDVLVDEYKIFKIRNKLLQAENSKKISSITHQENSEDEEAPDVISTKRKRSKQGRRPRRRYARNAREESHSTSSVETRQVYPKRSTSRFKKRYYDSDTTDATDDNSTQEDIEVSDNDDIEVSALSDNNDIEDSRRSKRSRERRPGLSYGDETETCSIL